MHAINETETAVIVEPSQKAARAVIWMHGLGADGHDFVPIVNEMHFQAKVETRFIFPHAEVMPVTVNGGMSMRAWYDILQVDLVRRVDGKGILASVERIAGLIRQQTEQGIALDNIVLAGFSQGGVIALHTALQLNLPLAGVMALSTYLPIRDTIDADVKLEVFLAHGTEDGIVPYNEAISSRQWLNERDHQVEWHDYVMMHNVCPEEVTDIANWLAKVLPA